MEDKKLTSRELLIKTSKKGAMWVAMFDICLLVNFSEIASSYFGKSASWFNQRLHGYRVNGKYAKFKKEELQTLSAALRDIAKKILIAADRVDEMIN